MVIFVKWKEELNWHIKEVECEIHVVSTTSTDLAYVDASSSVVILTQELRLLHCHCFTLSSLNKFLLIILTFFTVWEILRKVFHYKGLL